MTPRHGQSRRRLERAVVSVIAAVILVGTIRLEGIPSNLAWIHLWGPSSSVMTSNSTVITACSSLLATGFSLDDDNEHIDHCLDFVSRSYPSQSDRRCTWCLPPSHRPNILVKRPQLLLEQATHTTVGLMFVKNTKAASSTGAGVTLRIAEQVGKRVLLDVDNKNHTTILPHQQLAASSCVRNWTHAFANYRGHAGRDPRRSLLWSIVRHPAKRDISAFVFFQQARLGVEVSDDNLLLYLKASQSGQFRYLYPTTLGTDAQDPSFLTWHQKHANQQHDAHTILHGLLLHYDFVGIAERMDESLAVLSLLWHLQPGDVVVLPSKTSGGYDDGKFRKTCHFIPATPKLSDTVRQYLHQNHSRDNWDYLLYAAANRSLDWTIERLGTVTVQQRVEQIQKLQKRAVATCESQAVYPCAGTGQRQWTKSQQSCYVDDTGCGHVCVDSVVY